MDAACNVCNVSDLHSYPGSFQLHHSLHADADDTEEAHAAATTFLDHMASISLHSYRKSLYQDGCVVADRYGRRRLRRKSGASNLTTTPSLSAASSPPPLSPSYSMSVMSQRSGFEQDTSFCMSRDLFSLGKNMADKADSRAYTHSRAQSEYAISRKLSTRLVCCIFIPFLQESSANTQYRTPSARDSNNLHH